MRYSLSEVARILGCTRQAVRNWCVKGQLHAEIFSVGGINHYAVTGEEIVNFLERSVIGDLTDVSTDVLCARAELYRKLADRLERMATCELEKAPDESNGEN